MHAVDTLSAWADALPDSDKMPVLFLGHGNPMNAIEPNRFTEALRQTGAALPRPRAVLCVSAHWYTRGTHVTAMTQPSTIHDFYGFPPALFAVQYPAAGSPELAQTVQHMLAPVAVGLDQDWGLDHGTWSVLLHLFPQADVPVVQLSIDASQGAAYHLQLAQALRRLRRKGVLLVGSGNIVHNLRLLAWDKMNDGFGFDWAESARATVNRHLLSGDTQALLQAAAHDPALHLAAPSPDHFLPLLYAMGASDESDSVQLFNDEIVGGALSMTSVRFG